MEMFDDIINNDSPNNNLQNNMQTQVSSSNFTNLSNLTLNNPLENSFIDTNQMSSSSSQPTEFEIINKLCYPKR